MGMMTSTALAIGGLAVSAGTTALSFKEAQSERNKMDAANDAAAEAMVEARKKLEVNYMDELSINKEAYEMQQDTILAQAQAATQLGVEGDARGASATAGRVQLATAAGAQQTRVQMGAELQKLEQLSAQEESRLRDIGVQLDLQEVQGAQEAARDAEARAYAAQKQVVQGVGDTAQQALGMVALYGGDASGEKDAMGKFAGDYEGDATYTGEIGRGKNKTTVENASLRNVDWENMTKKQYKRWSKSLTPSQQTSIFGSEAWGNIYQRPDSNPLGLGSGTDSLSGLNEAQRAYLASLSNK